MALMAITADNGLAAAETERSRLTRAYTQRVAALRIGLPLAALLLFAVVLLWPALTRQLIALPSLPNLPQLTMEQPRFSGTDDQNRPFSLSAARAMQHPGRLLLIDLEQIDATMTMSDGAPVSGAALRGRFDQEKKRLWLGGNVVMRHPGRKVSFSTSEMFVDFTQRAAWGDRPARLSGDFGLVEGRRYRVYDGGKLVMFTGGARAVLNSARGLDAPGAILDQQDAR